MPYRPPGVLGIWVEWLFIFRELGSTGNYFRGAREQAHNFGDIGSLAKKQKKKAKASICLIFIPRHTLVSGYYVMPFGVCPSVRPCSSFPMPHFSVGVLCYAFRCLSVRPSVRAHHFRSIT